MTNDNWQIEKSPTDLFCTGRARVERIFAQKKKKGMVAHPRVLTQRTPVLRSGDKLALLRALLGRLFRSGFLLCAAFLCCCHIVYLLSLIFYLAHKIV